MHIYTACQAVSVSYSTNRQLSFSLQQTRRQLVEALCRRLPRDKRKSLQDVDHSAGLVPRDPALSAAAPEERGTAQEDRVRADFDVDGYIPGLYAR